MGIFHDILIVSIPTLITCRSDTTPGTKYCKQLACSGTIYLPDSTVCCIVSLLVGPIPASLYDLTVTV